MFRIMIAGFKPETNSYSEHPITLSDYEKSSFLFGEGVKGELLMALREVTGPALPNLTSFDGRKVPYRHVPHPIYPLDEIGEI